MTAHPDLVGGQGADDTDLMRALPGWAAKRGAEGLFCARSPDETRADLVPVPPNAGRDTGDTSQNHALHRRALRLANDPL